MIKYSFLVVLFISILTGCEQADPKPAKFRPSRIEEIGYKRQLTYDAGGRLTTIISTSVMVDKQPITTVQKIEYDAEARISRSIIDNEREYTYEWSDSRLAATEEIEKGRTTNRYEFVYDAGGGLKEMLTYQHGASGLVLIGKVAYAFYADGNLSSVKSFDYEEGFGYELKAMYEYDRYDHAESVDSKFDVNPLMRGIRLHKNNPGRMVTKNKNGVAVSIEDYAYAHTLNGLPLKRETTITFLHTGSTGSYVTNYFFEQY
jgi:hypothetical protein